MHRLCELLCDILIIFVIFIRALDDFIVNICNIPHLVDIIAQPAQIPDYHIDSGINSGMSQVAIIINRDSAHIHADFPGHQRFEDFFLARQRIKYTQHVCHASPILLLLANLNACPNRCLILFCPKILAICASSGTYVLPVSATRKGMNNFLPWMPKVFFISARTLGKSIPYLSTACSASTKNCSPASVIKFNSLSSICTLSWKNIFAHMAASRGNSILVLMVSAKSCRSVSGT